MAYCGATWCAVLICGVLHAVLPYLYLLYHLYLWAYRLWVLRDDRLLAMLRTSNRARGPDGTLTPWSLCQYWYLGLGGGHIALYGHGEGVGMLITSSKSSCGAISLDIGPLPPVRGTIKRPLVHI